jgi:predicted RND superfamily exporter protein
MKRILVGFSIRHPKLVVVFAILLTLIAGSQFPRIHIDTDPENMLPADEPVRVFHHHVKEVFGLNDFLVVGIVRDAGVFTPEILRRVKRLTDAVVEMDGVVADDVLAPSEVDDIEPMENGGIRVATLMEEPPETQEGASEILARIHGNPILRGKLASDDGKALAIFVPLKSKDYAKQVGDQIQALIDADHGDEEYHLAGLPIAEDSFGSEMFSQMVVAAPLAFGLIFLLMLFFFRRPNVVIAPMIVAMMSVIWTMGLLIGMGFTVHIMSSMIPIFLIPIAVLNSIHLLSEVHAHYQRSASMDQTIRRSMDELFLPMLFASVTTVVGFGSLILTPIPPVQVFGGFVAFGVFVSWLLSVTFLPSYAMLLPTKALAKFGRGHEGLGAPHSHLHLLRRFSLRFRAGVLAGLAVVLVVSVWGVTKIVVNDNPVNWFKKSHPLRVADRVMNQHLAGTYLAYLTLSGPDDGAFLDPAWMSYVEKLQNHLAEVPNVGGVTSIADVVKKVQYELLDRAPGSKSLPDSREAIAQYLFLYEMSGGSPDDLFKFITPEHNEVAVWVQMRAGENRKVQAVVRDADRWMAENPPPAGMKSGWAGLSYINVIWQEKMVAGMGKALLGSYLTVLLMMILLFRSIRLGLISMIPLTATIAMTYGYIGWTGRPYDMPVAVLSSLALGLSIDFSIHFIQRFREIFRANRGDFNASMVELFQTPAEALARNVLVISLGFIPMFFSHLVPYVTVGAFFFAIMVISGLATFISLTAIFSYLPARVIAGRGNSISETRTAVAV